MVLVRGSWHEARRSGAVRPLLHGRMFFRAADSLCGGPTESPRRVSLLPSARFLAPTTTVACDTDASAGRGSRRRAGGCGAKASRVMGDERKLKR